MVTKSIITFGIALLTWQSLWSQVIPLHARICVHNSSLHSDGLKYIGHVSVSSLFAKPTVSDDSGYVKLTFIGVATGSIIALNVEHHELEVVNRSDVEQVVLGRRLPLRISMAPKGQLALAQAEFYKISKKALFGRQDAIIAELKGTTAQQAAMLENLKTNYHDSLQNVYLAEKRTRAKVKELETQLDETAMKLAAADLDQEDGRYRAALEAFKAGNLLEVITILDDSTMDKSLAEKLAQINQLQSDTAVDELALERLEAELQQVEHKFTLKSIAQQLLLQFSDAAASQEKSIVVLKVLRMPKSSSHYTSAYQRLGRSYRQQGLTEKAVEANQTAIQHAQSSSRPDTLHMIQCYQEVALSLQQGGHVAEALEWQNRALDYGRQVLPDNSIQLAMMMQKTAEIQLLNHASTAAGNLQNAAIAILQSVSGLPSATLGDAFRLQSSIYAEQGDLASANKAITQSIQLTQAGEAPDLRMVADDLEQLAQWQRQTGDLQGAIQSATEALRLTEQFEPGNHPDKAELLIEMAEMYEASGETDLALELSKRANVMYDSTLGIDHPDKERCLSVQSKAELASCEPQDALKSIEEVLKIQLQDTNAMPVDIAASYRQLAEINMRLKRLDDAMTAHTKAIEHMEKSDDVKPAELAAQYLQLALSQVQKGKTPESIVSLQKAIEKLGGGTPAAELEQAERLLYFKNIGMALMGLSEKDAETFSSERLKQQPE